MLKADIETKLNQAIFHFNKMKASKEDIPALESFFAAYLAALKSAVYYIQTWMISAGKINTKSGFWPRLKSWEQTHLSTDQRERWACIVALRNKDIHVTPIVPNVEEVGYFPQGYFPKGYFPKSYWPHFDKFTVAHPVTNQVYDVIDVCQTGIDIVGKLAKEYLKI